MPRIIVQVTEGERDGVILLQERVSCRDLDSDHFAGQLVERLGWALLDAEGVEAPRARSEIGRASDPHRGVSIGDR
jgi:hypothetical protein